jgi:hypothetical protein
LARVRQEPKALASVAGGDVGLEIGSHFAELPRDPGKGLLFAFIGGEARDKLAIFRVGEELFQLRF